MLDRGYPPHNIEKFLQELAWRDYWQRVWIAKGEVINYDLRNEQWDVENHEFAVAIAKAQTGIVAIDQAIEHFYEHDYLHNHLRMYIAAIACNLGKSHWQLPSKWMYYHLIDGDWASNTLSWQWVAGANANKKYYANQENINKYCYTDQKGGFLDVAYSEFEKLDVPEELRDTFIPVFETPLPEGSSLKLDLSKPLHVYNYYNLDPVWRSDAEANRVLLIEPTVFYEYPISQNAMDFMLELSKNIEGIQVFVGSFEDLAQQMDPRQIYFKEHPLNGHYKGNEDPRDWMFSVEGYYPSFFGFWKKCKKELKYASTI